MGSISRAIEKRRRTVAMERAMALHEDREIIICLGNRKDFQRATQQAKS